MSDARLRQLVADLESDREDLDRVLDEGARCLEELSGRPPTSLEVRGAGNIVHDFYNAVEHFCARIAVELDGGLPAGPDYHAQLLRRMTRPVEGARPAVLGVLLRDRLQEYLHFRHVYRHGYGFALSWPRLVPLLAGMSDLAPELRRQLDAFTGTLRALADRL
jgi:hypothetical protein